MCHFRGLYPNPCFWLKSPHPDCYAKNKTAEQSLSGTDSNEPARAFTSYVDPFFGLLTVSPHQSVSGGYFRYEVSFIAAFETSILFKTGLRLFSGRSFDIPSSVSRES